MKKIIALASVLCGGLAIDSIAFAEIYKWMDAEGKTHFSDQPPDRDSRIDIVTTHRINAYQGQSATPAVGALSSDSGANGATTPAAMAAQVELYTTSWCPYCKQARQFFRSRGIAFKDYDVERDSGAAARKAQLDSNSGVPFAIVNGTKIHGYSEVAYAEALTGRR